MKRRKKVIDFLVSGMKKGNYICSKRKTNSKYIRFVSNLLIDIRHKLDEIKRTKEELEQARVDLEGGKYFVL